MAVGFPLGDPLAHLRALSIAAAAGFAALWSWRAATDSRLAGAGTLTPVEIAGTAAGVLTLAVSRSFFASATTAGPVAAGALVAIALLVLAERVWRSPWDQRLGLGSQRCRAPAPARRWRRRPSAGRPRCWSGRERYDAASAGQRRRRSSSGFARARQHRRPRARVGADCRGRLRPPSLPGTGLVRRRQRPAPIWARGPELADQVGVLGLLVAAAGIARLTAGARVATLWPLLAGLGLRATLGADADGTIGIIVAAAAVALPLAAGTVRLAERLGRAALPSAAAIGVIVVVWPLLAR